MSQQIKEIPVRQLTIHPALGESGMLPDVITAEEPPGKSRDGHRQRVEEAREAWDALVADVTAHGVREPILAVVTDDSGQWKIVDGRHRHAAAVEAELETVPVIEVNDDEALDIILSSLAHRRHVSKGAVAWQAVKLFTDVATGGEERQIKLAGKRKHGPSAKITEGPEMTIPDLAKKAGVSIRYVEAACQLYRAWINPLMKDRRERVEAAVWLGASIIQLAGRLDFEITCAENNVSAVPDMAEAKQAKAFGRWENLCGRLQLKALDDWQELTESEKADIAGRFREAVRGLPEELADAAAVALEERETA